MHQNKFQKKEWSKNLERIWQVPARVPLVALHVCLDVACSRAKNIFIILNRGILAIVSTRHGVRSATNHAWIASSRDGAHGIFRAVGI